MLLAVRPKPLDGVLSNRLEHPVPALVRPPDEVPLVEGRERLTGSLAHG